jgi:hypothetical protein
MAKKFITNTTVGETLTKCKAIPTGTKTNRRFAQLDKRISFNNLAGVLSRAAAVFAGYSLRELLSRRFRCHQCRFDPGVTSPVSKSDEGGDVGVIGEVVSGKIGGAEVDLSSPGRVAFRSRESRPPLTGIVARLRTPIDSGGSELYDRGWPTICFPTLA